MPSKIVKRQNYLKNHTIIAEFCDKNNIEYVTYNNGFQVRLEDILDLYPVSGRWHKLSNGQRGDWEDEEDLRKIMLEAMGVIRDIPSPIGESRVKLKKKPLLKRIKETIDYFKHNK